MSENFIPLMVPDIQSSDIEAVVEVLSSGMLIQGSKVKSLENTIASYLGIKHAIALSSGTASLHLALVAFDIEPGDEVIVPAFSFVATANVVELVGATPVFVDVNIDTFNIDVNQIEDKITPKTKAIIPVHEFGLACNINEVLKIAKKHKLLVIEDAACALGATNNMRFAGTIGEVGSFSFHPRKAITGGEGGLLVTNDDSIAEEIRIMRNHGITVENDKIEFVRAGFNYRMTDFQAALILNQFQRLGHILEYKTNLATLYFKNLNDFDEIQLPTIPDGEKHTWQSFHIVVNQINRDQLIVSLREKGIGTNYGAQCIPYQKYYQNKYNLDCEKLYPNALKAYKQGLVLPLYERLNIHDINKISSILKQLIQNA